MKEEYIQTLHPDPSKTNKRIALRKYTMVKENLMAILQEHEVTHTELMELLYARISATFEGGVQWYGETVKLDLEARGIVARTADKPQKYYLVNT